MPYCKNCGSVVEETANVCPCCGVAQNNQPAPGTPGTPDTANDTGGFLFGLLGCCIPLVGLILFLVWKTERPKSAKAAGIGAIVGVVSIVLLYVLIFGLAFGLTAMGYAYFVPAFLG